MSWEVTQGAKWLLCTNKALSPDPLLNQDRWHTPKSSSGRQRQDSVVLLDSVAKMVNSRFREGLENKK